MEESDFDELMRIQRFMASRIVQESEMDAKIKLLDLINEMHLDKKGRINKEKLLVEAQLQGMSENEVTRLIEELKRDHFIAEEEEGYLRKIS